MLKLNQIAYSALASTSRQPRWWILAFAQVVALSLIGGLARPNLLYPPLIYWLAFGFILLQPVLVWLWLDIEAVRSREIKKSVPRVFWSCCQRSAYIIFGGMAALMLARMIYPNWIFLAIFSSLVAATCALAVLYVVLCGQSIGAALRLAMDTWHKKVSLGVAAALVLIVAHGISFTMVHGLWPHLRELGEFSALTHSATIWILLAALVLAIAYFAAVLNCFMVNLFLEIITRPKDPEVVKQAVSRLAVSPAGT